MAAVTWPTTLSQHLEVNGFTNGPGENAVSNEFNIGGPQVRQIQFGAPEPIRGSIIVSTSEIATFKEFYNTTLRAGSQRFNWVDPYTRTSVEMMFTPRNPWSITPIGPVAFRISMNLLMFS